jgi:hypothetical protein
LPGLLVFASCLILLIISVILENDGTLW